METTPGVYVSSSKVLSERLRGALRSFLEAAYDGDFAEEDWQHALGGEHVWCHDERGIAAHGSVVPRTLWTGGRRWSVGYVEAVATRADLRGRGIGGAVMRALGRIVGECYEFGALSSAAESFYRGLGWELWRGPTWVAAARELANREGWVRTAEEDGGIMVLRGEGARAIDLEGALVCEWRVGDVW